MARDIKEKTVEELEAELKEPFYEYYDEKTDKVIPVTLEEMVKKETEEREADEKRKKDEESLKKDTNVAKFAGKR